MMRRHDCRKDSLDMDKVYLKSRYDKGEAAYLNCPMTEEEFDRFHEALTSAETVPLKNLKKKFSLKVACRLKSWQSGERKQCFSDR